jgi:tetratricopeptide (TPR) repeat protein
MKIEEVDYPTICLNMIVKNESKIITRLFDSVLSLIDSYCICDTGSTDNTVSIIKEYFETHNIPGKIIYQEFKNFSQARNYSLNNCFNEDGSPISDYILLLDADMILEVKEDITTFKKSLNMDSYNILQGTDTFYYNNMRIIKNIVNNGNILYNMFKYIGVTHEYISTPDYIQKINLSKDIIFIRDIGDGGSKIDKFSRDIKLLKNEIEENPNSDRDHFYLANSYYSIGKYEDAIEIYKKRIKLGGWIQETWYSYYRIGLCYKNINKMSDAIYNWLEAYNHFPDRIENLYQIISYYRIIGNCKLALIFYKLAKEILNKKSNIDTYLFLEKDIYSYKLDYEFTIIALYCDITNIANELINIFNNCEEEYLIDNVLSNMKFYKFILKPLSVIDMSFSTFFKIGEKEIKFNSSSQCIIPDNNGYLTNIRLVNYKIDDRGNYLDCDENIISINKFVKLTKEFKNVEDKIFSTDNNELNRRYIGVEDIRIFKETEESVSFIGTGYHKNNTIGVVIGKYDKDKDALISNEIKSSFSNNICEKNWIYVKYKNETHVIYNWHPLQICKIIDNKLELFETKNTPLLFKNLRGSTCGFEYNDELWFINHIVSYETPREYYHIFSVFDKELNLLRYSQPFKFEGEKIEYCLSLIVEKDRILCSYSTWDRTTKLVIYDIKYIESLLIYK